MYQEIKLKIEKRLAKNSRTSKSMTLLAVSKTRSAQDIMMLFEQGLEQFGENYVQEAIAKKALLPQAVAHNIIWHFIGPLQSNKAKQVAQHFDWVQSIDTIKLMHKLNRFRPSDLPRLNLCIQVNIDSAATKSGLAPEVEQIISLMQAAESLPQVVIRGLMIMPDAGSPAYLAQCFSAAQQLFQQTQQRLQEEMPEAVQKFDTLSMGMSADYELAIDAGSTILRLGTALFGPRV